MAVDSKEKNSEVKNCNLSYGISKGKMSWLLHILSLLDRLSFPQKSLILKCIPVFSITWNTGTKSRCPTRWLLFSGSNHMIWYDCLCIDFSDWWLLSIGSPTFLVIPPTNTFYYFTDSGGVRSDTEQYFYLIFNLIFNWRWGTIIEQQVHTTSER